MCGAGGLGGAKLNPSVGAFLCAGMAVGGVRHPDGERPGLEQRPAGLRSLLTAGTATRYLIRAAPAAAPAAPEQTPITFRVHFVLITRDLKVPFHSKWTLREQFVPWGLPQHLGWHPALLEGPR